MLPKTMPLPGGRGWRMCPVRTPEWSPCPSTSTLRPMVRSGKRRAGASDGAAPAAAQQRVERERLLEEVEGAEADDAHRGLDRAVPRDDDDRHPGRLVAHPLDQLDAVHLGHPHVHDRQPRRDVLEQLERAAPVGGLEHLEALVGEHAAQRSEEHTSELQSRTLISYAVFCLKK